MIISVHFAADVSVYTHLRTLRMGPQGPGSRHMVSGQERWHTKNLTCDTICIFIPLSGLHWKPLALVFRG